MKCKIPPSVYFLPVDLPIAFPAVLTCPQKLSSFLTCDPLHFQFHDCCLLLFCPSHGTLYLEQKELHFSSGNFILLPELTLYALSYASDENDSADCTLHKSTENYLFFAPELLLPTSFISTHALTASKSAPAVLSPKASPARFLLAEQFFKEIQRKQPYYQDVAKGLLLSLLSSFSSCSSSQASCSSALDWFYNSLRYMQSNYAKPLTIPEVAKSCCDLSPSQFRKKFAVLTGTSPLSYLQRLRIQAACRELYLREKSIGEIAADSGFPTLSCFHRQFQEQMYCSPSAWLAKYSHP